ncbi:MAG: zinc-ribbon domain-containing protein [Clostridia bacterium]
MADGPKPKFYPQCGTKNEVGTKFCGSCGEKLI